MKVLQLFVVYTFAAFWRHAVFVDNSLDGHDAFHECFWSWWASWDVNVNWDELVDALYDCVGVEDAAC